MIFGVRIGAVLSPGRLSVFLSLLAALAVPIAAQASGDHVHSLRAAIEDLSAQFGDRYPRAEEFLRRLNTYVADVGAQTVPTHDFFRLQREALIANPLVSDNPILFVVRPQYLSDHHNTATLFQKGEINEASFRGGSALKCIDFAGQGTVRTLIEAANGIIRDPDVYFDGTRILFSMRKDIDDDYHIYEIAANGADPAQLTCAGGVSDIDPFYLPDNGVGFSSTREPKYCMCNRHIMANLFRMERDGANIHQIGKSTLFEGHGTLTPDGRVLYYRWEYVDRNFGDAQGLWTVNPDGTNHAVYWGNNTNSPGAVIDARPIPDSERAICVFGSCHDRPWGALAIIDRRLGLDGRDPVIQTWPADAVDLVGVGDFDTFKRVNPKYEDPYPLSEKYFLCSRMTGPDENMGIYLIDVFGNELLLYAEGAGCFDPMPLAPRPRPPVLPTRRDYEDAEGYFYVADVYEGTHLQGVERGTVKYLRVVESPEKRFWTKSSWNGQGQAAPAMNWHDFNNKRILGVVPVRADGSVYFAAPSDTFLYFQLLDENGMMVQSMRSGTMVQSGEVAGCAGCHDNRLEAPSFAWYGAAPSALQGPPNRLDGWYGPARLFNYLDEVQPVFDKNCVECHDFDNAQGELVLAGDKTLTFNVSYTELWRKGLIQVPGAGPADIQDAYTWGSHASRLVQVLREGHQGIELDRESMDRIVTWIDINAPYYPHYSSAFPKNLAGRSPLDDQQLGRLGELTGTDFAKLADYRTNRGPEVSLDRPELSPCLQRIPDKTSAAYIEALALIRAGRETLAQRPRADMEGFAACAVDQQRQEKYTLWRGIEQQNREAIRNARSSYDAGSE